MTRTQELLAKATAIYLLDISASNSNGSRARYSAYVLTDDGLEVIWPDYQYGDQESGYKYLGSDEAKALNMSHCSLKQYPAFHFIRNGYGYSKASDVLNDICEYAGRRIPGFLLTGHSPSPISTQWSTKFDKKEASV